MSNMNVAWIYTSLTLGLYVMENTYKLCVMWLFDSGVNNKQHQLIQLTF
jgi:hypothetical protein